MARYHGYRGRLYLSTSGTGTASPVASLNSWSINFPSDKGDRTAFGDRHISYARGMQDPKGKVGGLFDDATLATLKSASESADGAKFYLYPSLDVAARYFYGTTWVDPSYGGAVKGMTTAEFDLVPATDDWDYKTA